MLETGISWLSEIVSCQDVTWILNITSHHINPVNTVDRPGLVSPVVCYCVITDRCDGVNINTTSSTLQDVLSSSHHQLSSGEMPCHQIFKRDT